MTLEDLISPPARKIAEAAPWSVPSVPFSLAVRPNSVTVMTIELFQTSFE